MASLFEKIANGDIPSHKIYEDTLCYGFLDINPLSVGHCLVIPRKCFVTLDEVPEDVAAALGVAVTKVARAVKRAMKCPAYNILQNNGYLSGQVVPHVHFHIIPRFEGDSSGLNFEWKTRTLESDEGPKLAASIRAELQ